MSFAAIRKRRNGSFAVKTITEIVQPDVKVDDDLLQIHGNSATIYLTERPWRGPTGSEYTIEIPGFTRVETDPSGSFEFFCDWETGILFFDANITWGTPLAVTYTGVGAIVDWDKLDAAMSGSLTYVNPDPTPFTVGGIPAGSSFPTPHTMKELWDLLLYPYQVPAFTLFTFSWPSTLEVGESTPANPTATWNTSNSGNVAPNSVDIVDVTGSADLVLNTANDNTEALTLAPILKNSATSHTFRISAQDVQSTTVSRDYSVRWQWRRFWGEDLSAGPYPNETPIEALRASGLSATFGGTYSFNALVAGYKVIAYPSLMGTATTFINTANNFEVPFDDVYTVSVTNGHGVTTLYNVHRSLNALGGAINIAVS